MNKNTIPKYTKAQAMRIAKAFCALEAGTYEVVTAFNNPRKKTLTQYGIEGRPTIRRGSQFKVKSRRGSHTYPNPTAGGSDIVVTWDVISIEGVCSGLFQDGENRIDGKDRTTVVQWDDENKKTPLSMDERRTLRFIEVFLENATKLGRTFGDIIGEVAHFDSKDVLAQLVETGAVTVEQVMAANTAVNNMDAGNDTDSPNLFAFRRRNGMGN